MSWAADSSSVAAMTLPIEVVLSMATTSLPVGGMMQRSACGRTIRRSVCSRCMPSASAASVWPWSTEAIPPRTISAM